mgnify:CR=1 FL=1
MPTELAISTKTCLVEQEGNVLIVTLNRPEAKNAFNPEMLLGLYKAWRLLDEDDNLHCAILTANGDTFCAGMDLKVGPDGDQGTTQEFMDLMGTVPNIHWQALLRENRPCKPLLLAVEGYALVGEHVTAQQALEFGLINRVVPKGETLVEAKKLAAKICANGPLAVKAVVRSLREHTEHLAEDDAMQKSDILAGPVFGSKDAKEGMRAFKEKRPAVFTGE